VAKVEELPIHRSHSLDMLRSARRLAPWVRRYLGQVSQADPDNQVDLKNLQLPEDPMMLTCWAAALLQIPAYEKQPLLEAAAAGDLLAGVLRLYRRETALLDHLINVSEEEAERATMLN
jgi:hypothetical protein